MILTPGFPANEADTTCLPFLQSHVAVLANNFPGIEVVVLAFQYPYKKGSYKWRNIEVVSFDGRERGRGSRLKIWMQVWAKLRSLNKERKLIGLFSLWCTECALMGSYFAKWNNLKHYNWICGQDAKAGNKYVKLIRPKPEELVTVSDFLQKEFFKNYNIKPAHVISTGVDAPKTSGDNSLRDIDVLGVGSLKPLKQFDVFVAVIQNLKQTLPSISATLCGAGPCRDDINTQIMSLGLRGNVTLAGEVEHEKLLQIMQRTKILLHTSEYEGLSVACLEALAAGAHVVSFVRSMNEEIPHWHYVKNEEEMVQKAMGLLQHSTLSHSSVVPFTTDGAAEKIMKLFSS